MMSLFIVNVPPFCLLQFDWKLKNINYSKAFVFEQCKFDAFDYIKKVILNI